MPKEEAPDGKKPKKCSDKQTARDKKGCGPSSGQSRSAESYEPTVVAPILPQWRTGTPGGAPSGRFGYACRISL